MQLSPASRGVRAQWRLQYKVPVPGLLERLGHDAGWLFGLLRARALAANSLRGRAVLNDFESELATLTGEGRIPWPDRYVRPSPAYRSRPVTPPPTFPLLSPGQSLVALHGLADMDPDAREIVELLLDRAFAGARAGALSGEARINLTSLALPDPYGQRWRGGLLEPPQRVTEPGLLAARRMLGHAFEDGTAREADPTGLDPDTAIDLLCCATVVRTCLRLSGDLPVEGPASTVEPAANDAPVAETA